MMRILHLIPTLGGGGAERQLAYLAGGLRALDCDVHVGIQRGGSNLPLLEAAGATVHPLETRSNYDPVNLLRIVRLIRRVKPDFVQTWLTQMDVMGGAAAILTGTPWIVSERSSGAHYPRDFRHFLRRVLARRAKAVIANSKGGFEFWKTCAAPQFMVPNAVPHAAIAAAERDLDDYGASQVILFAGRFDEVKNLDNLVRALAKVVRERDAVALLCGAGPLEEQVRAAIDAAGCSGRIRLLGFRDRVTSLMKRADVLVAVSWFEGHPNVVIEAAAAGCPLVLSDIEAHRFFDDRSALFAPPGDADAIAAAIAASLDDPAAARARACQASELVREWSVERASSAYLRIYKELHARLAG
jgi:glycosyltransferase involved in cell wall biosynthesis